MELSSVIELQKKELTISWQSVSVVYNKIIKKIETDLGANRLCYKLSLIDIREAISVALNSQVRFGYTNSEWINLIDINSIELKTELTNKQFNKMTHKLLIFLQIHINKDSFSLINQSLKLLFSSKEQVSWFNLSNKLSLLESPREIIYQINFITNTKLVS